MLQALSSDFQSYQKASSARKEGEGKWWVIGDYFYTTKPTHKVNIQVHPDDLLKAMDILTTKGFFLNSDLWGNTYQKAAKHGSGSLSIILYESPDYPEYARNSDNDPYQ